MTGIAETFGAINHAITDAGKALERLRNGEIAPDQLLSEYIKIRNRSDLTALYEEFSETFGNKGGNIACLPALSEKLHGNVKGGIAAKDTDFYPGMIYSTPLMNYMMRRALDKEDADTCYKLYVNGIDTLAADMGESADGHYPPQDLIEEITAEPLKQISALPAPKIHIIANDDDNQMPPPTQ